MTNDSYGSVIPSHAEFVRHREYQRRSLGADSPLRAQALSLQMQAEQYAYGHLNEWCGVPVIRLPDDILLLQEIIWHTRPGFIVETGVARGGSLVLSASLMAMAGLDPRVLGIDIQILPHARTSIGESPFAESISLWQGDSASPEAAAAARHFIAGTRAEGIGLLVLDSDHTHAHVLNELRSLSPLLPKGSLILVADTLIEEMPPGHYPDRPWDRGNNPLTALREFLSESDGYQLSARWGNRGLLTEFREGVLEKISTRDQSAQE